MNLFAPIKTGLRKVNKQNMVWIIPIVIVFFVVTVLVIGAMLAPLPVFLYSIL
jgi:hypothetical protein